MQMPFHIRGVTLIELMIVISITAILAMIGIPAFQGVIDRNRLKAATDTLQGDLQFAKSEAIKRNTPVRVNFTFSNGDATNGYATWCYGMKENADCDCSDDAPLCEVGGIKKVVMGSDSYPGTKVVTTANFSFDNVRGTVNAGSVTLISAQSKRTKVVVSGMGGIRSCSAAGGTEVWGYSTSCP